MPRHKLPTRTQFPQMPASFPDVLGAIQWVLERAESKQLGPDLARNPTSKLSVIKRCQEEIIRLRRQISMDVAVIKYLEDKLEAQEKPCSSPKPPPSTSSAPDVATSSTDDAPT